MFSIALFDSVRANLNETSDQLNSLSALPEIMHLYRYSKFSSLLTSLSRQGKFQLIILQSLSTPFPDLSLARRIRQYDRRVPIIIVSAKDAPMDRVTGITLGSDDYMVKPFLPLELVARVKALFRRAGYIRQDAGETLVCANLSLDPRSRCMTVDGAHFSVTPTEFAFLQYLMERRGEAVSKQVLLKEVWELPDYDLDTRVADDLVKRLRRKFREAGCRAAIETVWGYGFRLEEDRGERS